MTPTYDRVTSFKYDWAKINPSQRAQSLVAVDKLVADIKAGRGFRKSLRVKRVQGIKDVQVYEMTWAPDRRATWEYGPEIRSRDPHIVWRRIGGHDIFRNP